MRLFIKEIINHSSGRQALLSSIRLADFTCLPYRWYRISTACSYHHHSSVVYTSASASSPLCLLHNSTARHECTAPYDRRKPGKAMRACLMTGNKSRWGVLLPRCPLSLLKSAGSLAGSRRQRELPNPTLGPTNPKIKLSAHDEDSNFRRTNISHTYTNLH